MLTATIKRAIAINELRLKFLKEQCEPCEAYEGSACDECLEEAMLTLCEELGIDLYEEVDTEKATLEECLEANIAYLSGLL